jgi:hypothetical protein
MDGRRRGTSPAFRHGRRFSRPGSDLQVCITPSAYVRETARLVVVHGVSGRLVVSGALLYRSRHNRVNRPVGNV